MLRKARSPRVAVLASLAVLVSLWLPQATAQGQVIAPQSAAVSAADGSAGPGPAGINWAAVPWLRRALAGVTLHRGIPAKVHGLQVGNFSACPKLPKGDDPAQFFCLIIHVTGGLLAMGASTQIINRNITISFAQGADPNGNTVDVFGEETSKPMPVLGGIFLNPSVNGLTQPHPDLRLAVQPKGLGAAPDPTGATASFMFMKVKAISPAFGPNCFIGNSKHPVVLDPTFGTTNPPPPNIPISGDVQAAEFTGQEIIAIGTVVDNAFAAPRAFSCGPGGKGALTSVVNTVGSLPSPAGTNTAIFQVTAELVPYQNIAS